ncbi:MAG: hypothetical protein RR386_01695 [Bacteroidaceae bacterium]
MLTIGLLLLFFVGFFATCNVALRSSLTEKIGFAFPVGVGIVTFAMMFMDWMGMALTATSILGCCLVLLVGLAALLFPRKTALLGALQPTIQIKKLNLVWLLLLVVLGWVAYGNFTKCMYFPTYDRDSMAAFDTVGFLIAKEHTLSALSVFQGDYMTAMHGAGSTITYTPMVQLSYAFVYSLGAETSKTIPAFMFLSFLVGFYGLIARQIGHTAAITTTLFVAFTPEMLSFSSLSGTNVMHAGLASTGLIYTVLWFTKGDKQHLYFATLLLAINVWCRAEGVAFIGAAGLLVLIRLLKQKDYKLMAFPIMALLPAIIWALFTKTNQMTSESIVITHLFWDATKADTIWNYASDLFCNTQYYGWTFTLGLLALLANAYFMVKRCDNVALAGSLLLTVVLYFIILYQIDYKWDSMENVLRYSAKRYLFSFVPVVWYFVASSHLVRNAFSYIDKTLAYPSE